MQALTGLNDGSDVLSQGLLVELCTPGVSTGQARGPGRPAVTRSACSYANTLELERASASPRGDVPSLFMAACVIKTAFLDLLWKASKLALT